MEGTQYIANIYLDERSVLRLNAQVDHERKVAIFDLLEDNSFDPIDAPPGPYNVILAIEDNRLVFDVRDITNKKLTKFALPVASFRRVVKDYFMICESYFDAIKRASPSHIEAIDMGRRGLHNEGAELLRERISDKAIVDADTARRLFTLICVLHIRA
jgi:uncharacterized protein (UPF0262 family)